MMEKIQQWLKRAEEEDIKYNNNEGETNPIK